MDVITSRVEYRSSVFIKTVFEATFSFSNILQITQATFSLVLYRCSTVPESVFFLGLDTKIGILLGFLESNEMFRKFQDFQTIMFIKNTVEPRLTTTPLLRPLFCGPNKRPLIFLSENRVNPTTPLLRPTTTLGSPESLFSL